MEYYLAVKKNKSLIHNTTWLNLKIIIMTKILLCDCIPIKFSQYITRNKNRLVVAWKRVWMGKGWKEELNRYEKTFRIDGYV